MAPKSPKYNTINDSDLPPEASLPSISRCNITSSSLSTLTPSTTLSRSSIDHSVLKGTSKGKGKGKDTSAPNTEPETRIHRSKISKSELTAVWLRRSDTTEAQISNVRGKSTTISVSEAKDTTLRRSNLWHAKVFSSLLARTEVRMSSIEESQLRRSEVQHSHVLKSWVRRSEVKSSQVRNSRLKRATVRHCDVTECVLEGGKYENMVLKHEIWKKGKFVGRLGEKDVEAWKNTESDSESEDSEEEKDGYESEKYESEKHVSERHESPPPPYSQCA